MVRSPETRPKQSALVDRWSLGNSAVYTKRQTRRKAATQSYGSRRFLDRQATELN